MDIVKVTPIAERLPFEELTYFSSEKYKVFDIVQISIKNRKLFAIINEIIPIEKAKIDIKNASFSLKKINSKALPNFLSQAFIESAKELVKYECSSLSEILHSTVPAILWKNKFVTESNIESSKTKVKILPQILQMNDEERFAYIRTRIRELFASRKSVFIIVPQIEDAQKIHTALSKGIEAYSVILHSAIPNKELEQRINRIYKDEHPLCIIATPPFLSIFRKDLGLIVLENEPSRYYKEQRKPFIDFRFFAEKLAINSDIPFILSAELLRAETVARKEWKEVEPINPIVYRFRQPTISHIVSMSELQAKKSELVLFSKEALSVIFEAQEKKERLVIFCPRKGLSPTVVCGDCGIMLSCSNCSSAYTLHSGKAEKENYLLCHTCGERRGAEVLCNHCSSWNIKALGIGIQRIESELKNILPLANIFKIDGDSAKNNKEVKKVIEDFSNNPGSILIGTRKMLPFLPYDIPHIIIATIDSLLSLPDFRMSEKIFRLCISLRNHAYKSFIIQTRRIDSNIFENITSSSVDKFFTSLLDERSKLSYPPYSKLIKLTINGEKENITKIMKEIQKSVEPYTLHVFPAFIKSDKGSSLHGLIKIPRNVWPNDELISKLKIWKNLVSIDIDPESLL